MFYNPTNPIFQLFSLTSTAVVLPCLVILFPPIFIFLSCLRFSISLSPSRNHFSLSLSLSLSLSACFFAILFFILFFCVCYFAWCLEFRWWENVGKQKEIYIFSYFGMFSKYIHDFECFNYLYIYIYCLVVGVWVLRKCGKAKGQRFFFSSLIYLASKKLEATKSRLNQTNWNPISLVLVFLLYDSVLVPNLVKSKISVQWKNRTSNQSNRIDYTPS